MLNIFIETVKIDTKSPLFSPLLAASHKGLPKTYFQICGRDPLRDEDIAYAQALHENGVEVKMEMYVIYSFGIICDLLMRMRMKIYRMSSYISLCRCGYESCEEVSR